ncbi:MAG: hypothetical protein AAF197_09255 [Pseudomonadota bacterium]
MQPKRTKYGDLQMSAAELTQIGCTVVMALAVIVIGLNRWLVGRGIGVRSIQFLGIALLVPGAVILALDGKISSEAAIAILAALAGYLFASISKFDDRND